MRNSSEPQTALANEAGFGLVEVMLAVAVSSIGVLALAAASSGIGSQNLLSRWDTDGALVARHTLDRAAAAGFGQTASGSGSVAAGGRVYPVVRSVSPLSSRLEEITVRVASAGRNPVAFVTRLASARPLPAAP